MPPRATRSSARVAAAATSPPPAAPAPAKAAKAPAKKRGAKAKPADDAADADDAEDEPAPAKKTRGKRTKAAAAEDDEDDGADQPSTKKVKVADSTSDANADKDKDADMKDTKDDKDDKKDDKPQDAPAKMVTVLKRGAAPVDPESGLVSSHQVYQQGDEVFDAMLNQTSIQNNNNKFYVVQLLQNIANSSIILYTRWGRVGENGQCQKKGPFSAPTAIQEFKKQFKAKSATNWENRHDMVAKPGKYLWIERDYEEQKPIQLNDGANLKEPDCTLDPEVQVLMKMIFSSKTFDAALSSMNYDANKLPLGALSKSTILRGFEALKRLAEVIEDNSGNKAARCQQLTSAYYSVIPHSFGRSIPAVIDTPNKLKRELELVDALGDMEIAQKLISGSSLVDENGDPINQLDSHFRSLQLDQMDPIDQKTNEFGRLQTYIESTRGKTHSSFGKLDIQHAFRVNRSAETKAWKEAGFDKLGEGERLLLWHGSRSSNFGGILKTGLRIAPPEAPVTGYMFGKGVYFADAMTKSANYCHASSSDHIGIMLLCEVAAKPFYELQNADYHADQGCKKAKALATKGIGRAQPKDWEDAGDALGHEELKGCYMPTADGLEDVSPPGVYLQYNEYIVYSPAQIRVRYLLMVNMKPTYMN